MSLLSEAMEDLTILDKQTVSDGYGGYSTRWIDGATIQAAIVYKTSNENQIAEAQGTKGIYSITTKKNLNLQYHDVLRREADGKIFRVTSDGDDHKTPKSAGLNMRVVTAEEWSITDE